MIADYRDLQSARVLAGVSLRDAGKAIGISESYLSRIEAGTRTLSLKQTKRLAVFLAAALRRTVEQAESFLELLRLDASGG